MAEAVGNAPLQFHPALAEEDRARAGYYGLLARLWYAGPDHALLQAIAGAEPPADGESVLGRAWNGLALAARAMDPEAAALEYDDVFVGTGKAEVTPYASHYLAETGREGVLVSLREELERAGLARAGAAGEPEDHFSALLDVMRHLVQAGSDDAALQHQRRFFARYLERAYRPLCDCVAASGKANFYRYVAALARAFLDIESESLKVY